MTKLDKNEYNLKLEEIDTYVNQGNYSEAAKVADSIDWRRVRNVRTLCMISEIYEADNRYEDSKALLERAYRRSPVGRAILYRLVEVTIQLKQFDEAIEYYSEYVQAAPHDNNKYILKYKIYRGRGSSLEEQIDILKEYLAQEYNEKWAYELARLYQQADKIPECLATCDDLVLWFHSGKYVIKALELKRKYTNLTPKQQEIYDHRFEDMDAEEASDETALGQEKQIVETKEDALAETIMADTEKEIAQAIAGMGEEQKSEKEAGAEEKTETEAERLAREKEIREKEAEEALDEPIENAQEFDDQLNKYNTQDLQTELVKSMREIVSGVARRIEAEEQPEDLAIERSKEEQEAMRAAQAAREQEEMRAAQAAREQEAMRAAQAAREPEAAKAAAEAQQNRPFQMPPQQPVQQASQISIDDILLSMGERGDAMRRAAAKASASAAKPASGVVSAMDEALMGMGVEIPRQQDTEDELAKTAAAQEPAGEELQPEETAASTEENIVTAKTRRIPTDEIAEIHASFGLDQDGRRVNTIPQEPIAQTPSQQPAQEPTVQEQPQRTAQEPTVQEQPQRTVQEPTVQEQPQQPVREPAMQPQQPEGTFVQRFASRQQPSQQGRTMHGQQAVYGNRLMMQEYQRELFKGFLGIQNLEEQIASAIAQAGQKGDDRTSRTGNVLIFGGHGCGKTTIATGIAKAIAQERGEQFVKMAKIYASDFNRKDIAATIAKIAGGTLIIEEAGDLEDAVVDQLTTAMEFRTDGLIIILEDEQRYIHDLLMRHPRFTMKFTSQIFIPVFTIDELLRFGQIYAGDMDYVFSDAAVAALYDRIGNVAAQGEAISITNVIELVDRAISKSNKFFRKLSGKKRYDENNCIILQEKDFR